MKSRNKMRPPFMEKDKTEFQTEFQRFCELGGLILVAMERLDSGEGTEQDLEDANRNFDLFNDSVGEEMRQMFGAAIEARQPFRNKKNTPE
tara:strand:+ start:463 stop:735 length:273 start_codon:yes stop_codon:yes gene_type:complete